MASSSDAHFSNMIQFPRLPSVPESWDSAPDKSLLPPRPHSIRDGRTLKQSKSTESLSQRKDRVDFLRKREWTRRVASNGDQPFSIPKRTRTYSWEDIIAAADAAADSWDYSSSAALARRPDTIDELDESDEPYIIYTATPRPPAPSTYTPHTPGATVLYSTSPSPSPSPTLSPLGTSSPVRDLSPTSSAPTSAQYFPRKAWRGPHSRHSSLSSISEEDEGLVRF